MSWDVLVNIHEMSNYVKYIIIMVSIIQRGLYECCMVFGILILSLAGEHLHVIYFCLLFSVPNRRRCQLGFQRPPTCCKSSMRSTSSLRATATYSDERGWRPRDWF